MAASFFSLAPPSSSERWYDAFSTSKYVCRITYMHSSRITYTHRHLCISLHHDTRNALLPTRYSQHTTTTTHLVAWQSRDRARPVDVVGSVAVAVDVEEGEHRAVVQDGL